ncbi:MAG TPA: lipoate--protein ligase family protein, partial [Terriglobales bacterium]|nr:lipoate--protein ligase family protein [Terriglobales bacterium]
MDEPFTRRPTPVLALNGMQLCELTLDSPADNLALDEALLDHCEENKTDEVLRFWQPTGYFVVLGYANAVSTEVHLPFCRHAGIPVLRRCSGGGTVLQGPGCLNYSLVLRATESGPLSGITGTNCFIMKRHRDALSPLLGQDVRISGHTDLAVSDRKFSGNAQRRKRRYILFHGSFLLDLDLAMVEKTLQMPARQPDYRAQRSHGDFLTNLRLPA